MIAQAAQALPVRRESRQIFGVHQGRHEPGAHGLDVLGAVAEQRPDASVDEEGALLVEIENLDHTRRDISDAPEKVFALLQLGLRLQQLGAVLGAVLATVDGALLLQLCGPQLGQAQ